MAEGTVPSWWGTLEEQASKDGVNPDFLRRVGGQESGFRNIGNDTTSASGPFQFIKGTWAGLSKRNPDLGLTNRFDPEQQARGIPRFTKENMDIMEGALGRRISGGEGYLAHFLGTGDAPRVAKAPDDTPIQNVVISSSLAANPGVFNKYSTVGQLRAWADRVSGGVSPYGDNYTPTQRTLTSPSRCRLLKAHSCLRRRRVLLSLSHATNSVTCRSSLGDAPLWTKPHSLPSVNESALKWAFHGDDKYIPNPDFRWTPELYKKITEGIPEENWGYFDRAHSEGHANFLRREMLKGPGIRPADGQPRSHRDGPEASSVPSSTP
jgi:hypothetical protein